ncbi:hypothetical protein OF83DRAFT_50646 [Amylostereum chailletii]|nr:hypothetical protein OF83DRAFT_50646 [Amylostereum chailletii]
MYTPQDPTACNIFRDQTPRYLVLRRIQNLGHASNHPSLFNIGHPLSPKYKTAVIFTEERDRSGATLLQPRHMQLSILNDFGANIATRCSEPTTELISRTCARNTVPNMSHLLVEASSTTGRVHSRSRWWSESGVSSRATGAIRCPHHRSGCQRHRTFEGRSPRRPQRRGWHPGEHNGEIATTLDIKDWTSSTLPTLHPPHSSPFPALKLVSSIYP